MAKLKLGPLVDDKPVRLTVDLPAQVHRDLAAYAEVLARESSQAVEPAKLIAPMLARFMASDRVFARRRRNEALATPRVSAGTAGGRAQRDTEATER